MVTMEERIVSDEERGYETIRRVFRARGLGDWEIQIYTGRGPRTLRGQLTNIGRTCVTMDSGGRHVEIHYSDIRFYDRKDYPTQRLNGVSGFLK